MLWHFGYPNGSSAERFDIIIRHRHDRGQTRRHRTNAPKILQPCQARDMGPTQDNLDAGHGLRFCRLCSSQIQTIGLSANNRRVLPGSSSSRSMTNLSLRYDRRSSSV
jgi:hypothetical protein